MATVPEQLRRAREEQRLSIHQVADLTKMRADHIRALEAGDYDAFSAAVYIRGFVRCYATLLKLPLAEVLRELDQELGQTTRFRELPSLTGTAKGPLDRLMLLASRLPWRILVPLALFLVIIGGAVYGVRLWQRDSRQAAPADLGPGLYRGPAPVVESLPLPTNSPATNPTPARPRR